MKTLFRESFAKDLEAVKDQSLLKRVRAVIESIEQAKNLREVANLKKLKGGARHYRIRVGDYRIGVTVDGGTVTFVRFLHRRELYRWFP